MMFKEMTTEKPEPSTYTAARNSSSGRTQHYSTRADPLHICLRVPSLLKQNGQSDFMFTQFFYPHVDFSLYQTVCDCSIMFFPTHQQPPLQKDLNKSFQICISGIFLRENSRDEEIIKVYTNKH